MKSVAQVVDDIRSIPGALIDRNFGQGREAVLAQVEVLLGESDAHYADELIATAQEHLARLRTQVLPYQLPDDYAFFLEFYGGLTIATDKYTLSVEGLGPMTEDWYGFVVWGDDAIYQNGLLGIGGLFYREEGVIFFLDLAGHIQQYCVIGVTCGDEEEQDYLSILRNRPDCWAKVADSFTEWLEQIAATNGKLGYI